MKQRSVKTGLLRKSPVVWGNFGIVSHMLAETVSTQQPSILVVSLPRSGSSWVGEVLGLSGSSLYLREPITQSYMVRAGSHSASFFEVPIDGPDRAGYAKFARAAFSGVPSFPRSIIKYPNQWSLSLRAEKRIVVKEVNPLAIEWISRVYQPRIILLIRHPAAVANSFFKLNWSDPKFEDRFSRETLDRELPERRHIPSSFWAQHGILQGLVLRLALRAFNTCKDFIVVRYEDLCDEPLSTFRRLYDFAELLWNVDIEDQILARSSTGGTADPGPYDVYRNSKVEAEKWKWEMSREAIEEVRTAYLSLNPSYYLDGEW